MLISLREEYGKIREDLSMTSSNITCRFSTAKQLLIAYVQSQLKAEEKSKINDDDKILEDIILPIDIEDICAFQKIKLIKSNSDEDFIGKVTQSSDGIAVIEVNMNKNEFEPRYRFTIAHELAHFNLHLRDGLPQGYKDDDLTMFRKEDNWNKEESEANGFAASLLMPGDLIIKNIYNIYSGIFNDSNVGSNGASIKKGDLVRRLSIVFNVSSTAMEYRLINMGILDPK